MFFFLFILGLSDGVYGDDPAAHFFTYREYTDPTPSYTIPLANFSNEIWSTGNYEKTADWIKVGNTNSGGVVQFWDRISTIPNVNYTHIRTNCRASGTPNPDAQCFLHMANTHPHADMKYGANAPHGDYRVYTLSNPRNLSATTDPSFRLQLINTGSTDATFLIPEVTLYLEPFKTYSNYTKSTVPNHPNVQKITASITTTDKFTLQTLAIANPYDFPAKIKHWFSMSFDMNSSYSAVPLIANATHMITYDILDESFLHLWRLFKSWYNMTYETSFKISIKPRKSFEISYYLIEHNSTSYEDALEYFQNEFKEVYQVQPLGFGASVPFHNLTKCFPNTEDRDIFLANFQWTVWPDTTKEYLPTFYFLEPTMIHIGFPYDEEHFEENFSNCHTDTCELIRDSYAYDRNLKEYLYPTYSGTRSTATLLFEANGLAHKSFLKNLTRLLNNGHRPPANGLHFDYYSWNTVSFVPNCKELVPNVLPYYLLEDERDDLTITIPLMADHFYHFKLFRDNASKGYSLNTAWILPQWAKFTAVAGYEISFISGSTVSISDYTRMRAWQLRYHMGSRPISLIDMTDPSILKEYFDEIFSIHLSIGSVPCFWNDYSHRYFWEDCDVINQLKDDYKKWSPVMKAVLNNTVFQPNNRNKVKMEFPRDSQNPEYNEEDEVNVEIHDLATWCPKDTNETSLDNCHVVVFLGYNAQHSVGSKFKRTAKIKVDTENDITCVLKSKNTKCDVSGNEVTVSMNGIDSLRTFRAVVIKIEDNKNKQTGKIAGIVISVLVVVVLAAAIIYALVMKRKRNNSNKSN
ncbi:hypothetical protein GPJ56_006250 [Histomonas meleagridis]|uniref:uncharacterized protein n=1 Tax=Histomonas meleagridis TaxID=135588 RepID=UPI00355A6125|nr:hypothetical protein GPJ56_006250 [Histomonas meleagridis]KAH0796934.1 hypothetical protein GO595_010827 [Histomonas meleagridis]